MGKVIGVTIYPSEFGKQRMAEEDQKGPTEFIQNEVQPTDEVTNNSEDVENGGRLVVKNCFPYVLFSY